MKCLYSLTALLLVAAVGCAKKNHSTAGDLPSNGSVTDITVKSPEPVTYDPMPVSAEPMVTEVPASTAGQTYTVKKGDTLYSIARQHYGNGNQWQKIAAANPGVTPANLKAGQTLTLP